MFYPYYYRTYKLEHGLVSPEEQRAADYRVGETAAVLAGIRKSLAGTVSHGTDVVGLFRRMRREAKGATPVRGVVQA